MFWILLGIIILILVILICAKWGDKIYDIFHKVTSNFTSSDDSKDKNNVNKSEESEDK